MQPLCVQVALTTTIAPLVRETATEKLAPVAGLTTTIFVWPGPTSLAFATNVSGAIDGDSDGVGLAEVLADGVTTFAPRFQTSLPFDLIQLYLYPRNTVFCPTLVHLIVGPVAATAPSCPNIANREADIPAKRLRRRSFIPETVTAKPLFC